LESSWKEANGTERGERWVNNVKCLSPDISISEGVKRIELMVPQDKEKV